MSTADTVDSSRRRYSSSSSSSLPSTILGTPCTPTRPFDYPPVENSHEGHHCTASTCHIERLSRDLVPTKQRLAAIQYAAAKEVADEYHTAHLNQLARAGVREGEVESDTETDPQGWRGTEGWRSKCTLSEVGHPAPMVLGLGMSLTRPPATIATAAEMGSLSDTTAAQGKVQQSDGVGLEYGSVAESKNGTRLRATPPRPGGEVSRPSWIAMTSTEYRKHVPDTWCLHPNPLSFHYIAQGEPRLGIGGMRIAAQEERVRESPHVTTASRHSSIWRHPNHLDGRVEGEEVGRDGKRYRGT